MRRAALVLALCFLANPLRAEPPEADFRADIYLAAEVYNGQCRHLLDLARARAACLTAKGYIEHAGGLLPRIADTGPIREHLLLREAYRGLIDSALIAIGESPGGLSPTQTNTGSLPPSGLTPLAGGDGSRVNTGMFAPDTHVKPATTGLSSLPSPRIYFGATESSLPPPSSPVLSEVSALLKAHPELSVRIEGHTDSVGEPARNRQLSQQRAETVKRILVESGVERERLQAVGFGPLRPAAANETPEGRSQNRRVEFLVLPAGPPQKLASPSQKLAPPPIVTPPRPPGPPQQLAPLPRSLPIGPPVPAPPRPAAPPAPAPGR